MVLRKTVSVPINVATGPVVFLESGHLHRRCETGADSGTREGVVTNLIRGSGLGQTRQIGSETLIVLLVQGGCR